MIFRLERASGRFQNAALFSSLLNRIEVLNGADTIQWFADEARRGYGRVVPPRNLAAQQLVLMEPVGPVAAFTPWNFPINQAVRKVAAALAAGCSIIVKAPEATPASVTR